MKRRGVELNAGEQMREEEENLRENLWREYSNRQEMWKLN